MAWRDPPLLVPRVVVPLLLIFLFFCDDCCSYSCLSWSSTNIRWEGVCHDARFPVDATTTIGVSEWCKDPLLVPPNDARIRHRFYPGVANSPPAFPTTVRRITIGISPGGAQQQMAHWFPQMKQRPAVRFAKLLKDPPCVCCEIRRSTVAVRE